MGPRTVAAVLVALTLLAREGHADGPPPDCVPPRIRDMSLPDGYPLSLEVDSQNNLYVLMYQGCCVYKFSPSGAMLGVFGTTAFSQTGLAVTESGRMYVVDGACRIVVLDTNGDLEFEWGDGCSTEPGHLANPFEAAVASNGDVYVCEQYNPRILRFTATGEYLGEWGSNGSGPGQFAGGVQGIACSPNGEVLALDSGNCRVERFSHDGTYLGEWQTGERYEGYCNLVAVASDDQGRVYVNDYVARSVRVFSPTGDPLCSWDGSRDRAFSFMGGVTVDHLGSIWVADQYGAQEFGYLPVLTKPTTWGRLRATYR